MESQGNPSQLNIVLPPRNSKAKLLPIIIVSILVSSLISGGGMFFWHKADSAKMQQKIEGLESNLELVKNDNETLKQDKLNFEKGLMELAAEKENIERKYCKGEWKNGTCVKSGCFDSDVNEKPNDIYIKGNVTSTDKDGVETVVYDECSGSKTQVNEMWCYESPTGSGNYVQGKMVYDCSNGCLGGACKE